MKTNYRKILDLKELEILIAITTSVRGEEQDGIMMTKEHRAYLEGCLYTLIDIYNTLDKDTTNLLKAEELLMSNI